MEALWEKTKKLFLKNRDYKEDTDYKFIDIGKNIMGIELLIRPYRGVQYYYTYVKFIEEDNPILQFEYKLLIPNEKLVDDNEFKKVIGKVLTAIIVSEKGENG